MLTLSPAPRGLTHFPGMRAHLVTSAVFVIGLALVVFAMQQPILQFWQAAFQALSGFVGLHSAIVLPACAYKSILCSDPASLYGISLSDQSANQTYAGLGIGAALMAASFGLSKFSVPLRYGLRLMAGFMLVPCLVELFVPEYFAADLGQDVAQVLRTGFLFLLLSPIILGLTGFIFPGAIWKKVAVTVAAMLYFVLLLPALAVVHLLALYWLGEGFLPFMNMVMTTLLMSFELAAFYGLLASQD